MTRPEIVTLKVNGTAYTGWTEIEIVRGINRCVSSFSFTASDTLNGPVIEPFNKCEIWANDDKMLTGFVEAVDPQFDSGRHTLKITGHSKTKDLPDCTPDIKSGQFSSFTVAAITRAICKLFDIEVDVQTDRAEAIVQNTNLERSETAFRFLERLGNLSGVLYSDDPDGRLVMAIAGGEKSKTHLEQGRNVLIGGAVFNVSRRFSHYIVKGQAGIADGSAINLDGIGGPDAPPVGEIQTQLRGLAIDKDVPRYRPHVTIAESQVTPAQAQARANWQKQFAYGQSIKIHAHVAGFRQDDGTLWRPNLLVPLTASWLYADSDLLITETKFTLGATSRGHVTELMLGPIEGYTPDPGAVKLHKERREKEGHGRGHHGKGGGINLDGIG